MAKWLGGAVATAIALAPVLALAETPVTVTILRFQQGQDPDPVAVADAIDAADTIGDGDFYARVRIGDNPFERNRVRFIEAADFQPMASPDWRFTRVIDADAGTIPVVIQMWDADPIENNDDIIDLNDQDNAQEIVLNLDLATCTWTGDAGPNGSRARGDGDREHFGAAEGGERGTLLFDVACSQNGDIDGDGIPDGVERFGIRDLDGSLALDLQGAGLATRADPCRSNIVVENDFMSGAADGHTHQPSTVALAELRAAFDGADLLVSTLSPAACPYPGFPTRTGGVGLVMLIDDNIAEQSGITTAQLDTIRDANFDPALRPYVHYALWAHNIVDAAGMVQGSGWCCRGGRKDFIVSLGSFNGPDVAGNTQNGSDRQQSGTFMHELGHALGLGHWGGPGLDLDSAGNPVDDEPFGTPNGRPDGRNCKPNYLSVMNYFFQFTGILDNTTGAQAIDYSRSKLPDLDEAMLSEQAGLGNGPLVTAWCDATGTPRAGPGDTPLDWDWDSTIALGTTIAVDIAADSAGRGSCCRGAGGINASPGETLRGFNDWRNLQFRAGMAPGAGAESVSFDNEPTAEDAERMRAFWESRLRCAPPEAGTWTVARDCTIWRDVTAPADLVVAGETVLTIGTGVTLDVDFANHALRVEPGARIEVQPDARIE